MKMIIHVGIIIVQYKSQSISKGKSNDLNPRSNRTPFCAITGLVFKGINGQANLKKRLDLEIKAVDKEIGQNA